MLEFHNDIWQKGYNHSENIFSNTDFTMSFKKKRPLEFNLNDNFLGIERNQINVFSHKFLETNEKLSQLTYHIFMICGLVNSLTSKKIILVKNILST